MSAPAARRAIAFSGGFGHPFAETTPVLVAEAERHGWAAEVMGDIDAVADRLSPEIGLLIVNALYWSMTQHEKYAPHRAEWARSLSHESMAKIAGWVADGGSLLVIHTGTICWDTQPGWIELMGGGWKWERSHHPPLGEIVVTLTDAGRDLSRGPVSFALIDEAYHNLDPAPDCTVLATSDTGSGPQPVAWVRKRGAGRVAIDALGHDARSLTEPGHAALVHGLFGWLGAEDA